MIELFIIYYLSLYVFPSFATESSNHHIFELIFGVWTILYITCNVNVYNVKNKIIIKYRHKIVNTYHWYFWLSYSQVDVLCSNRNVLICGVIFTDTGNMILWTSRIFWKFTRIDTSWRLKTERFWLWTLTNCLLIIK